MALGRAVWFGTRRSVVRIHSPRPTFSIASLALRQQRGQTPITNPAGRETVPDPQRPAECASTRRDGRRPDARLGGQHEIHMRTDRRSIVGLLRWRSAGGGLGCDERSSSLARHYTAALTRNAHAVPTESGVDRSRHLRYVKSAAQKRVQFLGSEERIGNGIAVFYYQQLRKRAPCQHCFHAAQRAHILVFQHPPAFRRRGER